MVLIIFIIFWFMKSSGMPTTWPHPLMHERSKIGIWIGIGKGGFDTFFYTSPIIKPFHCWGYVRLKHNNAKIYSYPSTSILIMNKPKFYLLHHQYKASYIYILAGNDSIVWVLWSWTQKVPFLLKGERTLLVTYALHPLKCVCVCVWTLKVWLSVCC